MKTLRTSLERSIPWRIAQAMARVLTTVLFRLEVHGREHVPDRGGAVVVSNHQSCLDPVLLNVRLTRTATFIAKSELFDGRITGWLLRTVFNAFPVRLGTGDVGAVKETIARLREGHLLNLYPEGARTVDGEIAPMQRGVGLVVRRAGVPVVPAVIIGAFEAWPRHRRMFRPHPIRVVYGPAMDLNDLRPDEIVSTIDRTLREMFRVERPATPGVTPLRRPPAPGDPSA